MTYIIAEPCLGTCDTSCVEVCPVDCILGPKDGPWADLDAIRAVPDDERPSKLEGIMLYIDPEDCINCGACEPECPVEAIFEEEEVPEKWEHYIEINAERFE